MPEPHATPPGDAPAPLLVSLSSYGASEVRRHGQAGFVQLAAEAGADGVEVRGELLAGGASELAEIASAGAGLQCVYSSPEGLWDTQGRLDAGALDRALVAARDLGAPRLKMSIGGYSRESAASLPALQASLRAAGTELLIENDQTPSAGTLAALERFDADLRDQGLALGLTFDLGNWHWQGECPLQAARTLAPRVRYVHCKGVQRDPRRWVAVPLAESSAPWRAILRAMPRGVPWAIEYPLVGDDLRAVTREQLALLRRTASELR